MYYVLHAFTFRIAHALFRSVAFLLHWSKGHVLCGVFFADSVLFYFLLYGALIYDLSAKRLTAPKGFPIGKENQKSA